MNKKGMVASTVVALIIAAILLAYFLSQFIPKLFEGIKNVPTTTPLDEVCCCLKDSRNTLCSVITKRQCDEKQDYVMAEDMKPCEGK